MRTRLNWRLAPLIMAAGLVLFVVGCSEKDEEASMTDQEAIQQLMLDDVDLENANAFWGDDNLGGGGPLDDPINPVRWGRLGLRELVSINVEIQGDSLATITRTINYNGTFRVLDGVNDTTLVRYDKPMYNTIVRKAHAVRIGRTRYPRRNWRISEVTPAVLVSAAPNPHTIEPTQVEVYQNTDSGMVLVADVTDPLNTYINRDTLPRIDPNNSVAVYAHANTLNPAAAFLHPHVFRAGRLQRLPLLDDGVSPDVAAGDGIYSGAYRTGEFEGVFVSGVDFLDHETLYDSADHYDAGGWAIPYRVAMP